MFTPKPVKRLLPHVISYPKCVILHRIYEIDHCSLYFHEDMFGFLPLVFCFNSRILNWCSRDFTKFTFKCHSCMALTTKTIRILSKVHLSRDLCYCPRSTARDLYYCPRSTSRDLYYVQGLFLRSYPQNRRLSFLMPDIWRRNGHYLGIMRRQDRESKNF